MSVTMQISAEEAARNPEGVSTTVYDGRTEYLRTTHVGMVIETGELNGYDDSDFYAVVWNPERGEPERVTYATTRGWTYLNSAQVDATPEVRAAYAAWHERAERARRQAERDARARQVEPGKRVRFLGTGRKQGYAAGDEGVVEWTGPNQFRRYYRGGYNRPENNMRAKVRMSNGAVVWVDANRVAVIVEQEVA